MLLTWQTSNILPAQSGQEDIVQSSSFKPVGGQHSHNNSVCLCPSYRQKWFRQTSLLVFLHESLCSFTTVEQVPEAKRREDFKDLHSFEQHADNLHIWEAEISEYLAFLIE